MSPVGFEPTISARERPQNYALSSAATACLRYSKVKKFVEINYNLVRLHVMRSSSAIVFRGGRTNQLSGKKGKTIPLQA